MPLNVQLNLPTSVPTLQPITLDSWRRGVITLIDKSRIPRDAAVEMKNLILAEDGVPTNRPGTGWYGTSANDQAIDGAQIYEKEDGSIHLVKATANGTIWSSTNNGSTWNACTGATLTGGIGVYMVQDHGFLYITNGTDNIVRYDGTTTLQTYTVLSTPGTVTPTETGSTIMSGTGYNHYYKVSAVNQVGFTVASAATTNVIAGSDRNNWTAATDSVSLAWTAIAGATRYDIYVSRDNVDFVYLDTVSTNSFKDDGTAYENFNILAPEDNTTQGPKVKRLEQIGSRLWGVEDSENPWRVWFSGPANYAGYFSTAYDGGYIDLMKGSQYRPIRVVDYRDGKGTPYATVWCKSADGTGCIWQITLETLTIENFSITVPSAFRLPGSRGTDAPDSVINVLNDYHFYNSQAFYNLGSRAQFLNLLSTDESSSNIRPTMKQISVGSAPGIASFYFDAKIYISVPYGTANNNYTIIYDTERKAWMPEAFTLGFARFLQYVEVNGDLRTVKLLAWKDGDTRLTEISSSIAGDYGESYETSLTTGLYPVAKDRFDFMYVEDGEVEFSQTRSGIFVELVGVERNQGFSTQVTQQISTQVSTVGWGTAAWSTVVWTDTSKTPDAFSESSVKRYFRVLRELNSFQWRITTTDRYSTYLLRTLQIKGTVTQGGKPRGWRLS